MELVLKEACNAILVSRRRRLIGEGQFKRATRAALLLARTSIKMFPQAELIDEALDIASRNELSVYDSLYLVVAKRLDAPLLSLDAQQMRTARKLGLRSITP